MRVRLLAIGLLTFACSQKLPAAPDSLRASLTAADAAVGNAAVPEAAAACERVAKELEGWAQSAKRANEAKPLLEELRDFGDNGLRLITTKQDWAELRGRIDRFVATGKPEAGPRFRRDLPKDVREAIATAEHAFDTGNQRGACEATDQATMALSAFVWTEPPPKDVAKLKDALERLDAMPDTCRTAPLSEVKQRFVDAVKPLER